MQESGLGLGAELSVSWSRTNESVEVVCLFLLSYVKA